MKVKIVKPAIIIALYAFSIAINIPLLALFINALATDRNHPLIYALFCCFFLAIMLILILRIYRRVGSKTLLINEHGIVYETSKKKVEMLWTNVKRVVILPDTVGRLNKNCYIFFVSTNDPRVFFERSPDKFNEGIIGVQYRPKLAREIERLSGRRIENIEYIEKE